MATSRLVRVVSVASLWEDDLRPRLEPSVELVTVDRHDRAARDAALSGADIVISVQFDDAMARAATSLRLLICPAAGTENIDRNALPGQVRVLNSPGAEIPIAEHVIGALVALRRHFVAADAALRRGEWRFGYHNPEEMLVELESSTLGLVGFGRIGREIAARARVFGMHCAAVTLHPENHNAASADVEWLDALANSAAVDKLVAWADAVVLCCEFSELTDGLMDARRFGLMKKTALLVNVARGRIAVERDLFQALQRKQIGGAALDVWYNYPHRSQKNAAPSNYPFQELDNVLLTPHCSGWTEGNKQRRLAWMARTINAFAAQLLRH